jgi:PEP-CTERM motif
MKLRPALLLCGTLLIAAVPAWADRISSPGFAKEFPGIDTLMKVAGSSSGLRLNVPVNAGIPSASVVVFSNGFDANNAFESWDSKSSSALGTFFPSSTDLDIHPVSLSDLDSDGGPSSRAHAWKAWLIKEEGEKHRGRGRLHHAGVIPTQVPEPGFISLLLFGLAAVGLFARRRREPPLPI